jgi:hypothetical protein
LVLARDPRRRIPEISPLGKGYPDDRTRTLREGKRRTAPLWTTTSTGELPGILAEPSNRRTSNGAGMPHARLTAEENKTMNLKLQYAIGRMQKREPHEAAAWLIKHSHDEERLQKLLDRLREIPEENLGAFVAQFAQDNPDLALLIDWVNTRWDWFVMTVREIKRQSEVNAVESSSGRSDGY